MKQLFQNCNELRVLAYFFKHPNEEIHVRELARKISLSAPTLLRALITLEKEGLVTTEKKQYIKLIRAQKTPTFKALKIAYTITGLETAVKKLEEKCKGLSSILLYGSASVGEDSQESDYDILVVANSCNATSLELSLLTKHEVNLKIVDIVEWKKISKNNRAFYLEVISKSNILYGVKPILN